MKQFLKYFFLFIWCIPQLALGQTPVPENGVKDSEPVAYVLKNAKVVVSSEKTLEKASVVIEDGRVQAVGKLVRKPKGAVEIDMKGKTIVPSFIELHADVGLPEPDKKKWKPRPQLKSKKKGAFYWNESIKPEMKAADHFEQKKEKAEQMQKMGYSVALTHIQDGIMRGTGAVVALGDVPEDEAVIRAEAAAFFSLKKGVSRQTYPSSQMGAIALFRQAMYDARYYDENKSCLPKNLSLEALNAQLNLPLFFDVDDKLEVLRVRKLAEEFDLPLNIIGGGNEYERIDAMQELKHPLVVPINFPAAYDVADPYVSRQIPLSDLKHWELAPGNPFFLEKKTVPFAISTKGHKKPADFWKHLHAAREAGLSREEAIRSLTERPAEMLNLSSDLGSIEAGKLASFSIYDNDPFEFKDVKLLESWSVGHRQILHKLPEVDIRGKYRFSLDSTSYVVEITGDAAQPKGKTKTYTTVVDSSENPPVETMDTTTAKVHIEREKNDAVFHFEVDDDFYTGVVTLHGHFNERLDLFLGQGQMPNGEWGSWTGVQIERHEDETEEKPLEIDTIAIEKLRYPNMAYGWDSLPGKQTYVLRNATLWTNESEGIVKEGTVIIKDGKIDFAGTGNFSVPADAVEIDCEGLHVTSGIIDEHSHIAISKGVNESGQAVSAEVSIADVVRSDDINIYRQLSGGVTASQLLHGSANPIGGQSALIKLKWGHAPGEMLIDDAPKFIKFALGENVKQSNWGSFRTVRFPQTRMGVEQVFYDAFKRAKKYEQKWEEYNALSPKRRKMKGVKRPAKDLELEAVLEIVNSERFISCHSYVQSEINMLMHVADSMGFTVNTFTHILEGYKVADKMAEHGAGGSTFSDWWAYKYEVKDAIPYNASLMNEQGVTVAINSDDAEMGRRLNQEAAKAIKYGGMTEEEAWKMVTLNPAKLLHLEDRMGSLKVGKDADVVVWSDHPLSIKARTLHVFVDGEELYRAADNSRHRQQIAQEKARIINKMLASNKKGEEKKTFKKKEKKHWHCDSIGEEAQ